MPAGRSDTPGSSRKHQNSQDSVFGGINGLVGEATRLRGRTWECFEYVGGGSWVAPENGLL